MGTPLDEHGQPTSQNYNANRRINRAVNELIGFMRGIVADNYVSAEESDALYKWVVANREIANIWPVKVLVDRFDRIYKDEVADEKERAELAELIKEIVGRQDEDTLQFGPSDLPLTKPAPEVVFESKEFVFTGRFLYGTRKACTTEVELRGGRCIDNVRLQTSYLVVGSLMSRDWKFSTYGLKILKAVEYAERCPIAIVSEKHWETFLRADRRADV